MALLAGGADVNEPKNNGCSGGTARHGLRVRATSSRHDVLAANADVNQADNNGATTLYKRLPSDFPIQFEVWETFVTRRHLVI